jgi:hypothetical protein
VLSELDSDPVYVRLCAATQTYRARYAARSAGYATCRRISSSGAQPSVEDAMVLELHDGASGVAQDLPLA